MSLIVFGSAFAAINLIGALLLGPRTAARIAVAGSTTALVDGLIETRSHGSLPVVSLRIDEDTLAALQADMPFSGGRYVDAVLEDEGKDIPVRFRHRGLVITTHYLGSKKSFRLRLPKRNPFAPLRRVNLVVPKTQDIVANAVGIAIARSMEAAVPFDDMAWVRINGDDVGLMEMMEEVGTGYERTHGIGTHKVTAFKGDLLTQDTTRSTLQRNLWTSLDNWNVLASADSNAAIHGMRAVLAWVNTPDSIAPPLDSLARWIDLSSFLRYCAAIQLLDSYHIDNHHNQWWLHGAAGKLYPVLWDVYPFYDRTNGHFHMAHDALSYQVLRNGAARLERDRVLFAAWKAMHEQHGAEAIIRSLVDRVRPAVLADREKWMSIALGDEHVYRGSDLHWFRAVKKFRLRMDEKLEALRRGFAINDLQVEQRDSTLRVRFTGEVSLKMTTADTLLAPGTAVGIGELRTMGGAWVIDPVADARGDAEARYRNRNFIEVRPVEVVIRFQGTLPRGLRFYNAVTDEEITPR